MTTFEQLGLSKEVLKVLEELGFETPSEIQIEAIPQLVQNNTDFIGLAQTGTGKTAAFGLPLLERIDTKDKSTQALVLAPTRELGQQIAEQLYKYSKYLHKVNVLAVYGGTSISNQIKALKKPVHIIIATPGRLIDLIKRKAVKLEELQYLVLDEADEMLNMGFKEEIDEILAYTPEDKLTWLFSATMPSAIKKIVKKYMDHPVEVKINPKNTVNENIEHQYVTVKQKDKSEALTRFLDIDTDLRGVVFCRTKRDTHELAEKLLKRKYKADAIHGDLSQQQRDRVMKRFKSHDLQVLIATDVAARGIDVDDLTHVFHFTLPDQTAYYTHRSGRTARAGKKGISVSFVGGREVGKIKFLERQLGISFRKIEVPDTEQIASLAIENWCGKILETKSRNRLDEELMEKASNLFADLSKEELIAKFLMNQLNQLNLTSSRDLNDAERSGGDKRGDRKRGDRRRGDGRDGERRRKNYKGKKSYGRGSRPKDKRREGGPKRDKRKGASAKSDKSRYKKKKK